MGRRLVLVLGLLVLAAVASEGLARGRRPDGVERKRVKLADAPAPVKAKVVAMLRKGKLASIELWTKGKRSAYKVEMTVNGKDVEVLLSGSGKVLETKVRDDADDKDGDDIDDGDDDDNDDDGDNDDDDDDGDNDEDVDDGDNDDDGKDIDDGDDDDGENEKGVRKLRGRGDDDDNHKRRGGKREKKPRRVRGGGQRGGNSD